MPLPKSVTKVSKNGVTFTSNVDQAQYLLRELERAALRDVAKLIRKRAIEKMKQLPGLKRSRRPYRATNYWIRKLEGDLQIGFGHAKKGTTGDTWYAIRQELGTKNHPKKGILRDTVFENIEEIRKIQGQYLSAIAEKNKALGLIDESEVMSDEND